MWCFSFCCFHFSYLIKLIYSETKFGNIKKNYTEIIEELLIRRRPVDIWVKAHVGNLSCTSPRRSVVLSHIGNEYSSDWPTIWQIDIQCYPFWEHSDVKVSFYTRKDISWNNNYNNIKHWFFCIPSTVKFKEPKNIAVSWLINNLKLVWEPEDDKRALAEVWFRRDGHSSWEKVRHVCFSTKSFASEENEPFCNTK